MKGVEESIPVLVSMLVQDPEFRHYSDAMVFEEPSHAARSVASRDCLLLVVRLVTRILDVFSLVLAGEKGDTMREAAKTFNPTRSIIGSFTSANGF